MLKSEGIETLLFDAHMSVMDGSIGALPRRLMVVHDEQFERAQAHSRGGGTQGRDVSTEGLTLDRFLGGRVIAAQPSDRISRRSRHGAAGGRRPCGSGFGLALELGSGAGDSEPLSGRARAGPRIVGIEIDPELVRLANDNAARNGVADRVSFVVGDASAFDHRSSFPPPFTESKRRSATADAVAGPSVSRSDGGRIFDHVFFNPPFHPDSAQ